MDLLREISERKSAKSFIGKDVGEDILRRVLEAGRLAPSAKNRQPWRFIVVRAPELKEKIYHAAYQQDQIARAPVLIALCTTNVDYTMPNGHLSYPMDISMAASFMMMQIEREGLDSCVLTTFDETEIKDLLSVPFSMRIPLLLLFGKAEHAPSLKERKSLESIVSYDHW